MDGEEEEIEKEEEREGGAVRWMGGRPPCMRVVRVRRECPFL